MGQKSLLVLLFLFCILISAKTHPEKIIALTLLSYLNIILSYDSFQFMYAFARCSYPKSSSAVIIFSSFSMGIKFMTLALLAQFSTTSAKNKLTITNKNQNQKPAKP